MKKDNILIFGSTGFLGSHLYKYLKNNDLYEIYISHRDEFCISNDSIKFKKSLNEKIKNCEIIINCLAETNFEKCSSNGVIANIEIPKALKKIACDNYIIHISTDAFYEAENNFSTEQASLTFNNLYSEQKHSSEKILEGDKTLILRTSFIGKNIRGVGLLNFIDSRIKNKAKIEGWSEVYTSSVHVNHLLTAIEKILSKRMHGIYNFGTKEPYSKHALIQSIYKKLNLDSELVVKVPEIDFNIKRNQRCGLDANLFSKDFNFKLPTLEDVVLESVNELLNE